MGDVRLERPIDRRTIEFVLAVLVLACAAVWVLEPALLTDSTVVERLWVPVAVFAPGLLALSVLSGAVAHGVRLGATLLGIGDRTRVGDTSLSSVLTSIVLGTLAAVTLWWVAGSLYVLWLSDVGGVVLAPFVALVAGSVLGVLVLSQAALARLFPDSPVSQLRGPVAD